jgi:hypothetical protein
MLNQETHAPHLHVHSADHTRCRPTSRSPGHRVPDMCDHPRSSTPGLLFLSRSLSLHVMPHLPPAHHETSKCNSPNETKVKKQNETIPDSNSNLAKSMNHHNQTKELITWFLNSDLKALRCLPYLVMQPSVRSRDHLRNIQYSGLKASGCLPYSVVWPSARFRDHLRT